MNRNGLIRKLRRKARKDKVSFAVDTTKGNGSHYWVEFNGKATTIQADLNPGRIERILKQLGIDPADL